MEVPKLFSSSSKLKNKFLEDSSLAKTTQNMSLTAHKNLGPFDHSSLTRSVSQSKERSINVLPTPTKVVDAPLYSARSLNFESSRYFSKDEVKTPDAAESFENTSSISCISEECTNYNSSASESEFSDDEHDIHFCFPSVTESNVASQFKWKAPKNPETEEYKIKGEFLNTILVASEKYMDLVDADEATISAILAQVEKVAINNAEFVLKVSLYLKRSLEIKSFSRFLMAYSCINLKTYVSKYYPKFTTTVEDWLILPNITVQLLAKFGNKVDGKLPACLRKAMVKKFPEFSETELSLISGKKCLVQKSCLKASNDFIHYSLKSLVRILHISNPVNLVTKIIGKKVLENELGENHKRNKLVPIMDVEYFLSEKGNKVKVWKELIDRSLLSYRDVLFNFKNIVMSGIDKICANKLAELLTNVDLIIESKIFPDEILKVMRISEHQFEEVCKKRDETKDETKKTFFTSIGFDIMPILDGSLLEALKISPRNIPITKGLTVLIYVLDGNEDTFLKNTTEIPTLSKAHNFINGMKNSCEGLHIYFQDKSGGWKIENDENYKFSNSQILMDSSWKYGKNRTERFFISKIDQKIDNLIFVHPGIDVVNYQEYVDDYRLTKNPKLLCVSLNFGTNSYMDLSCHPFTLKLSGLNLSSYLIISEYATKNLLKNVEKSYGLDYFDLFVDQPKWKPITVYVSSIYDDTKQEQKLFKNGISKVLKEKCSYQKINITFINLKQKLEQPLHYRLKTRFNEIRKSDIFIIFIGKYYGHKIDSEIYKELIEDKNIVCHLNDKPTSLIELEFLLAKSLGLPVICYLRSEDSITRLSNDLPENPQDDEALEKLIRSIKEIGIFEVYYDHEIKTNLFDRVTLSLWDKIVNHSYVRKESVEVIGRSKELVQICHALKDPKTEVINLNGLEGAGLTCLIHQMTTKARKMGFIVHSYFEDDLLCVEKGVSTYLCDSVKKVLGITNNKTGSFRDSLDDLIFMIDVPTLILVDSSRTDKPLNWIPKTKNSHIKYLISTNDEKTIRHYAKSFGYNLYSVSINNIANFDDKKAIAHSFFGEDEPSKKIMNALSSKWGNPSDLKVLLQMAHHFQTSYDTVSHYYKVSVAKALEIVSFSKLAVIISAFKIAPLGLTLDELSLVCNKYFEASGNHKLSFFNIVAVTNELKIFFKDQTQGILVLKTHKIVDKILKDYANVNIKKSMVDTFVEFFQMYSNGQVNTRILFTLMRLGSFEDFVDVSSFLLHCASNKILKEAGKYSKIFNERIKKDFYSLENQPMEIFHHPSSITGDSLDGEATVVLKYSDTLTFYGFADGSVGCVSLEDKNKSFIIKPHFFPVNSICFDNDTETLLSGSINDCNLHVYSTNNNIGGKYLKTDHKKTITGLIRLEKNLYVSIGEDGLIYKFSLSSKKFSATHTEALSAISLYSPNKLVLGSYKGEILCINTFNLCQSSLSAIKVSNGKILTVTVKEDLIFFSDILCGVGILKLNQGTVVRKIICTSPANTICLLNEFTVALGSQDGEVLFWNFTESNNSWNSISSDEDLGEISCLHNHREETYVGYTSGVMQVFNSDYGGVHRVKITTTPLMYITSHPECGVVFASFKTGFFGLNGKSEIENTYKAPNELLGPIHMDRTTFIVPKKNGSIDIFNMHLWSDAHSKVNISPRFSEEVVNGGIKFIQFRRHFLTVLNNSNEILVLEITNKYKIETIYTLKMEYTEVKEMFFLSTKTFVIKIIEENCETSPYLLEIRESTERQELTKSDEFFYIGVPEAESLFCFNHDKNSIVKLHDVVKIGIKNYSACRGSIDLLNGGTLILSDPIKYTCTSQYDTTPTFKLQNIQVDCHPSLALTYDDNFTIYAAFSHREGKFRYELGNKNKLIDVISAQKVSSPISTSVSSLV